MFELNLILEAAQKDRHLQLLVVVSQCEEELKQEATLGKDSFRLCPLHGSSEGGVLHGDVALQSH